MPARIRPLGGLKSYIQGQAEISVDSGRTVREILVSMTIPPEVIALVVVNGTPQNKDYCVQDNDTVQLFAVMSGG